MNEKVIYLFIAFSFVGCSIFQEDNWFEQNFSDCGKFGENWIGHTEHELIMEEGNSRFPVESDGADGKIVTYWYASRITNRSRIDIDRQFYINKQKIIYHVRCFYF